MGLFEKLRKSESKSSKTSLKDEFSKLKEETVEVIEEVQRAATRTVRLRYRSSCGCGGGYEDVYREVPYDSPLKDGDVIREMEKGDRW